MEKCEKQDKPNSDLSYLYLCGINHSSYNSKPITILSLSTFHEQVQVGPINSNVRNILLLNNSLMTETRQCSNLRGRRR